MSSGDSSFTVLPNELLTNYNYDKLIGNYILQLVSIRDISIPQYNSENEFLRVDEEPEEGEIDEETLKGKKASTQNKKPPPPKKKSHRVLCLNLSDGNNIVKAIEYQPIHSLKPDIPIGSKILIKGPVDVSFKVLLLKSHNIQVTGSPSPKSTLTSIKTPLKPETMGVQEPPESKSSIKAEPFVSSIISYDNPVKANLEKSIVDLSSTLGSENLEYYLDDLDDEILE